MKHRPYYNYYDITIVTVFERCVKPIVAFCAQIIVLKWNIAFERKQIEFLKYKDLSYFRYHFSNKKTPKPLISQEFRRPCQVVEVTGFEPTTSASRTQRSTKLSHTSSTASDIIHRMYWLVNRKIEKIQKISKRIEINQVLFGERHLN